MSKVILESAAAHQPFKNAHHFIYIFKSIKSDVVIGDSRYKN